MWKYLNSFFDSVLFLIHFYTFSFEFVYTMADVVWDKQKTYKLIELLESSPELWNCILKEYRDRQLKVKCMGKIAQELEISSAEVGRKLHNLRFQMNSELRKIKNKKSGAGADEPRKVLGSFSIN